MPNLFSIPALPKNVSKENLDEYNRYTWRLIRIYIAAMLFRRFHNPIRVFFSYSESRSRLWTYLLNFYIRHVCYRHNMTAFRYTDEAIKSHPLDIEAHCAVVDRELKAADIYVRFLDSHVEPQWQMTRDDAFMDRVKLNPFTLEPIIGSFDYLAYEVEKSDEYFYDNNCRLQLMLAGEHLNVVPDSRRVTVMVFDPERDNPWQFAQKVAAKIREMARVRSSVRNTRSIKQG